MKTINPIKGEIIKSERGSTLLIVVMIFAVLSVMGAALMTTTAAHVNNQKVQEFRKFGFYGSESGIDKMVALFTAQLQVSNDEASGFASDLLEIGKEMQYMEYITYLEAKRAEEYGGPQAEPFESYFNTFSDANDYEDFEQYEIFDKYTKYDLYSYFNSYNSNVAPLYLYNLEGTVNQQAALDFTSYVHSIKFKELYETWVKDTFVTLPSTTTNDDLETLWDETDPAVIADKMAALDLMDFETVIKMGVRPENAAFGSGDILEVPIFSIYSPTASGEEDIKKPTARKLLTAELQITKPDYAMPLMVEQEVMKFDPNILWTKALTAGGSIELGAGSVINGNVYSGSGDDEPGIIAEGAGVTINGEAVTGGNITLASEGTELTINGNAYAFKMINDQADGIINVNKDVNSLTFYSYYVPGENNENEGGTVDFRDSGDVVLKSNMELRDSNGEINIEGNFCGFSEELDPSPGANPNPSSCIIVDTNTGKVNIGGETIISGSAYYEFDVDNLADNFRTGESVALRNNFRGYSNWLVDDAPGGNFFANFINDFFENHGDEPPENPTEENMHYKNYFGLFAPEKYEDIEQDILDMELDVLDRADYFYQIAKMEEDSSFGDPDTPTENMSQFINKDDGRVSLNGEIAANGVVFSDDNVIERRKGFVSEGFNGKQRDGKYFYDLQTDYFGDFDRYNDVSGGDPEGETGAISSEFNFNSFTGTASKTDDYDDYYVVQTSAATDTTIENDTGGPIKVRGVIITRGNVHIDDNIRFYGTIIAEGNITVGSNTIIYNDRDVIAKTMYKYNNIYKSFKKKSKVMPTLTTYPDTGTANTVTREHYVYADIKEMEIENKYATVKDVISVRAWEVVEY